MRSRNLWALGKLAVTKQDREISWSTFCSFTAADMQTSEEKGIKVCVFHYPAFRGWEGCIPTLQSSESEYNEKSFAVAAVKGVVCPVLSRKASLVTSYTRHDSTSKGSKG